MDSSLGDVVGDVVLVVDFDVNGDVEVVSVQVAVAVAVKVHGHAYAYVYEASMTSPYGSHPERLCFRARRE